MSAPKDVVRLGFKVPHLKLARVKARVSLQSRLSLDSEFATRFIPMKSPPLCDGVQPTVSSRPGFCSRVIRIGLLTCLGALAHALAASWEVDLAGREIIALRADPLRAAVYGLNRGAAGTNSSLVVFDSETGQPVRELTLASDPTDFSLTPLADALFVIHFQSRTLSKINPDTLTIEATRQLPSLPDHWAGVHYNVAAADSNRVCFTDAAWAPTAYLYDFAAGTVLGRVNPENQGVGALTFASDGKTLFVCSQFGWSAGVLSAWLFRVDFSDPANPGTARSEIWQNRDPYDTPVLLTRSEDRIFNKQRVFDASNPRETLLSFPEDIYAISQEGDLAVGASRVFNGRTGEAIYTLPFTTMVSVVSGDQKNLFLVNRTTRRLSVIPIADFASIPTVELQPTPRVGEAVPPDQAELAWSATPTAIRYQIYLGTNATEVAEAGPDSPLHLGNTTGRSWPLSGLAPRTMYFWRVDTVTIVQTNRGPVWHFTVGPLRVIPRTVTALGYRGFAAEPQTLRVEAVAGTPAWRARSTVSWLSVTPTAGEGSAELTLNFATAELASGLHHGAVRIAVEEAEYEVPVVLRIRPMQLTRLVADRERPRLYGLEQPPDNASGWTLVVLDSRTGALLKTLPIGRNATDLTVHYPEQRLYVSNWQETFTRVVDLISLTELPPLEMGLPDYGWDDYRINAGKAGRLIVEGRDQWVHLTLRDTRTGAKVAQITFAVREGDGETDPTGEFYYHCDNNISNAHITKYRVGHDRLEAVATSTQHPYGSRNLILSPDGSRLFWRGFVYDADLNELGPVGEEIYACTHDGAFAISETRVFDTRTFQPNYTLPVKTTIMAVAADQATLWLFNPTNYVLSALPLQAVTNRPPTSENLMLTTPEDTPVPVALRGADPENDPLVFDLLTLPVHGTLSGEPPALVYTPASNFFGTDSFTYVTRDAWRTSAVAIVTINVTPVNDPPRTRDALVKVLTDLPRQIRLEAEDPEGDPLTYTVLSAPLQGRLEGAGPLVTYYPASGFAGTDSFTYRVSDGQADSATATVTLVVGPPGCFAGVNRGLWGWWRGEGRAVEEYGGSPVTLDQVAYGPGLAGQAFGFNGSNSVLSLPDLPALPPAGGAFTLAFWLRVDEAGREHTVVHWPPVRLWTAPSDMGGNRLDLWLKTGATAPGVLILSNLLQVGSWHHLALAAQPTGQGYQVYVNGLPGTPVSAGPPPQSFGNVPVLGRGTGATDSLAGAVDELVLFERMLSAEEADALYLARGESLCPEPAPPRFVLQPETATVFRGANLEWRSLARGTPPVSYQWLWNGAPLSGATSADLVLSNIHPSQSGTYQVVAQNTYGSVTSQVALVSVLVPPPLVNGSFEDGLSGWLVSNIAQPYLRVTNRLTGTRPSTSFFVLQATHGRMVAVHGFEGAGPGVIRLAQDVTLPEIHPILSFDYRAAWRLPADKQPKVFSVNLEPPGGGRVLQSFPILVVPPGTTNLDTGPLSAVLDLSDYAGQSIRLAFDAEVPERLAGPALLQLDNVQIASAAPPQITLPPTGGAAALGGNITLRVEAQGLAPLTYRWQRNGVDLFGGSGSFLALPNLTEAHSGVYRVRVSNPYGEVWSEPVVVSVLPAGTLGKPEWSATGRFRIPVAAEAGVRYTLEVSSDLISWAPAAEATVMSGAFLWFEDAAAAQHPHRFYRVRRP